MRVTFRKLSWTVIALAASSAAAMPAFADETGTEASHVNENVRLVDGPVVGNARDQAGILSFKGIPYAAPPVGELRWREPAPAKPWQAPLSARSFGAQCWGVKVPGAPDAPAIGSEDCLFLNVWTAATSDKERRPVMVWIHGGGFLRGTASADYLDGSHLAADGVVVVTLNYRLGVFGFMAHPLLDSESGRGSGMYGMLDQIAALRWVRNNIAAFGGDPENVTIFGESAGSHAVSFLMASPLAKGLFQRAIGESGALWRSENGPIHRTADADRLGVALQEKLGAKSLADMRRVPASDLHEATPWSPATDPGVATFAPIVDGYVLPEDPYQIFAKGEQNDVPLLAGWNAHEFGPFQGRALPHKDAGTFIAAAKAKFGADRMDEFLKLYPAASDTEASASAMRLSGDEVISFPTWLWVDIQTQTGKSAVYAYNFGFTSPYTPLPNHTSEIAYVFGNFPIKGTVSASPADVEFSKIIRSYWINFAKTGNPNGPNLATWNKYAPDKGRVLELSAGISEIPNPDLRQFQFLKSFWQIHP